jgi:hypothetical protein
MSQRRSQPRRRSRDCLHHPAATEVIEGAAASEATAATEAVGAAEGFGFWEVIGDILILVLK